MSDFQENVKIAGEPISAAILCLSDALTSRSFWDSFGHEFAIALRVALFGGGYEDQQVRADIREPLGDIASAIRDLADSAKV